MVWAKTLRIVDLFMISLNVITERKEFILGPMIFKIAVFQKVRLLFSVVVVEVNLDQ